MFSNKSFSLVLLLFLLSGWGCKKTVDTIKEDLMIKLITTNTWKVVRYMQGSSNITAHFSAYEFKFNKNGNVDAVKNGLVESTGTWLGSETTQSITSSFPASASDTLQRLSGVWLITNTKSNPWRVFSHRFEGGKELILDLEEKK